MASPGVNEGGVVPFILKNLTPGCAASPLSLPTHIIGKKGNYYLTFKERMSFDLSLRSMRVLNNTLHEYDYKYALKQPAAALHCRLGPTGAD
eukprot:5884169-Pleurochrysis_carterae.AAC.1